MKTRFVGKITVLFPDGYIEKCLVKEKTHKGESHFLGVVKQNVLTILKSCPKGPVKVTYNGDCAEQIGFAIQKIEEERR
jgi:hypothetical protein